MPLVPRPKVASKPVSAAISRFTWVPPATRTTLSRMPFSAVSYTHLTLPTTPYV